MDDGKHTRRSQRGLGLVVIIVIIQLNITHSFDTELENMRQEGLEKFDISVFVEEKVEYIHSRVTLKPLTSSIEFGDKLSREFANKVNTTLGRILDFRVKGLNHKVMMKLADMYEKSTNHVKREKRAIEFIGNLMSTLFGTIGPDQWKQNNRNILAMKEAIERQMANSLILHNDIDQNRHAINVQNEYLKHVSREVINNRNRLDIVDNALTELETYLEIESMYQSILDILESLEDVKRDALTGRCNEKGLDPEFLIDHLRRIESNKAGTAPVFASWEWQKYYSNEMCTLAIHNDELWSTMRIPIINLSEQLVRAIPTSNQRWITSKANEYGIETVLFHYKKLDMYMIMSRNNLEKCSKMNSVSICNVRKSKFKESNPFVVPLDINHGRILLLSNQSKLEMDVKSLCRNKVENVKIETLSVLQIPDQCAIVSRTYEISRSIQSTGIEHETPIEAVDRIIIHSIGKSDREVNLHELNLKIKPLSTIFANNNATSKLLESVQVDTFSKTETVLIASSGSLTVLVVSILTFILALYLAKKCRKNKSNSKSEPVVVVVDNAVEKK